MTRRFARLGVVLGLVSAVNAQEAAPKLPIADGPFAPEMESLEQYQYPEWFRDAKFGIWSHWGPQAVPMDGDWYAKHMYVKGHRQYQHHLETYGHPSEHGYKDIIALWKAEKWDPDRLMDLYQKAGARYFVSMGSHHDNFFLWDSALHPWNAVKMGPGRDIVGEWQKAAKERGMKFGVSEHLGASFTWFQPNRGADQDGPMAGVPYDGANPQWQSLYHPAAEPGDNSWYSTNPQWQQRWFACIRELVDDYQPDLLYTDGGVPFGNEVGLHMIAHLYNSIPDGVYTCKQRSEGRWVQDLERGVMAGINPEPWQTDTSIGDWYYNRNWKVRPVSWTIHMLVDIVSKNGNLLLNIVQRPDGSLDPDVEQQLEDLAHWIAIHGEAIYGSRPWHVFGEGAVRARGGHFNEQFAYSAQDIRFTTREDALYAIALGWPEDRRLRVRSLAAPAGTIHRVSLLGFEGPLQWEQTDTGLEVLLPEQTVSPYTCALKIHGDDLKPVPVEWITPVVQVDAAGRLVLDANDAALHGNQLRVESRGNRPNIGYWDDADEWVSWKVEIPHAGTFTIRATCATTTDGTRVMIESIGQQRPGRLPNTGGWDRFQTLELGTLSFEEPGTVEVSLKPADPTAWKAINVRNVTLQKQSNE